MNIIILAAGDGKRFEKSGSATFKQLTPINGVPLIRRIIIQILKIKQENNIFIVLGENQECNKEIKACLKDYQINFVHNNTSRSDNNLISLSEAFNNIIKRSRWKACRDGSLGLRCASDAKAACLCSDGCLSVWYGGNPL